MTRRVESHLLAAICVLLSASPALTSGITTTLKVSSFPSGAQVSVDGRNLRRVTPLSIALSPGDHVVTVGGPDSGWTSETRTVTIVEGANELSVTLFPLLIQGPPGADGAPGTTGQTAVSAYGTGLIQIEGEPFFQVIPGLETTVTVPEHSRVYISTKGGISGPIDAASTIDVRVDGQLLPRAFTQVVAIGEELSLSYWSMSGVVPLTAGTHTIQVFATFTRRFPVISGDADSERQGVLSVLVLKQ